MPKARLTRVGCLRRICRSCGTHREYRTRTPDASEWLCFVKPMDSVVGGVAADSTHQPQRTMFVARAAIDGFWREYASIQYLISVRPATNQ